jgi:hypothetical protein
VEITDDLTVPNGVKLVVPKGTTLTVKAGKKLTMASNDARDLWLDGTLVVEAGAKVIWGGVDRGPGTWNNQPTNPADKALEDLLAAVTGLNRDDVEINGPTLTLNPASKNATFTSEFTVPVGVTVVTPSDVEIKVDGANGKFTVPVGSSAELKGAVVVDNGGKIEVEGEVNVTKSLTVTEGTLDVKDNGTLDVTGTGTLTVTDGELNVANGGSVNVADGTLVLNDSDAALNVEAGGTLDVTGTGTLTVTQGTLDVKDGGAVEVADKGTLNVAQGSTLDVKGEGKVEVAGKAKIEVDGNLDMEENSQLVINGIFNIGANATSTELDSFKGKIIIEDGGVVASADGNPKFQGEGVTIVKAGGTATQVLGGLGTAIPIVGYDEEAGLQLHGQSVLEFSNTNFILTGDATLNGIELNGEKQYGIEKKTMDIKDGTLTIAADANFVSRESVLNIADDGLLKGEPGAKFIIDVNGCGASKITILGEQNFYDKGGNLQNFSAITTISAWTVYEWTENVNSSGNDGWQVK